MNLWAALARCHTVRLTMHAAGRRRYAGRTYASVRLVSVNPHWRTVGFRQRAGETVEALLWRALAELSKRELDGMPKPDPKAQRRRAHRKLLDTADPGRVM